MSSPRQPEITRKWEHLIDEAEEMYKKHMSCTNFDIAHRGAAVFAQLAKKMARKEEVHGYEQSEKSQANKRHNGGQPASVEDRLARLESLLSVD
jgi:hypothetical protein